MFDEENCFDITLATDEQKKQIGQICYWFNERIKSFVEGDFDEFIFFENYISIKSHVDILDNAYYHIDTRHNHYEIPNEIFYSDKDIKSYWNNILAENERKRIEEEVLKKQKREQEEKIKQEKMEKELYENLKKKYGG